MTKETIETIETRVPHTPHATLEQSLPQSLQQFYDTCLSKDAHALYLKSQKQVSAELEKRWQRSVATRAERALKLKEVELQPDLPISQAYEQVIEALNASQVVIVAGETGSGKTTQLPKICMLAGRGEAGVIGHTQPRRIAARSVASRIAHELGEKIGERVGFKVRFNDQSSSQSVIKLMTDGVLLAELHKDPFLVQYDTLIIDEAHERSLNIDFLLGYLKRLLPKRPDLKLIITSATLDTKRFSGFFKTDKPAPVVEVAGRSFPVDVSYMPPEDLDDDQEVLIQALNYCFDLAVQRGHPNQRDTLVFLPTTKEIDNAYELIQGHFQNTQVLKLHSRLSESEQQLVFDQSSRTAQTRIVLTTNIAETAVTVDQIRFVIDSGLHRISRFSMSSGVLRLPVEQISQASANQRAGRAGRVSSGVCVRLYSELDFESMREFSEPEISRTNLAGVVLTMRLLRLGDPSSFDFIDPVPPKRFRQAFKLLENLGALRGRGLSPHGRVMARLPIDPRLSKALALKQDTNQLKALCVVAAALSVVDVKERPVDKQGWADQQHAVFASDGSDFMWHVSLWTELEKQLSMNKKRKFAKAHSLSVRRVIEWQRMAKQLASMLDLEDLSLEPVDAAQLHRSLLQGLFDRIGTKHPKQKGAFLASAAPVVQLFPGSAAKKSKSDWIMAFEVIETSRVFYKTTAPVDPKWLLEDAGSLCKYKYHAPYFDTKTGTVRAHARVSLFGLELCSDLKVDYGAINAEESHAVFIQDALVQGKLGVKAGFLSHNLELVEKLAELEHKSRRLLLASDEASFDFYSQRVPKHVCSKKAFEQWRYHAEETSPKLLYMSLSDLSAEALPDESMFPDRLSVGQTHVGLIYRYEPGNTQDGLTIKAPLAALTQLSDMRYFAVPGWYEEQLYQLIKALPKELRVQLQPLQLTAAELADELRQIKAPNFNHVSKLLQQRGVLVSPNSLDPSSMPQYAKPLIQVVGKKNKVLAQSKDLEELNHKLNEKLNLTKSEPKGSKSFEDYPLGLSWQGSQGSVSLYKALTPVPAKQQADFTDPCNQQLSSSKVSGFELKDYVEQDLAQQWQRLSMGVMSFHKLSRQHKKLSSLISTSVLLKFAALGSSTELRELFVESVCASCVDAFFKDPQHMFNDQSVSAYFAELEALAFQHAANLSGFFETLFGELFEAKLKLQQLDPNVHENTLSDVEQQLATLAPECFARKNKVEQWQHFVRYLSALNKRLEALPGSFKKETAGLSELKPQLERLALLRGHFAKQNFPYGAAPVNEWVEQLEEFRVSLFAAPMKTRFSVSAKRLDKLWDKLCLELGLRF